MPSLIRKRTGDYVLYDRKKIANAIKKAFLETGEVRNPEEVAEALASVVEKRIKRYEVPTVEQIQDEVEKVLMERKYVATARAYIVYRENRKKIREAKQIMGIKDDLKLTLNAIKVLEARYLLKDEKGNIIKGLPIEEIEDRKVFHAGTALQENGDVITTGGRVLCACALGEDIKTAQEKAYHLTHDLNWYKVYYRDDIGFKAI